MIKNIIILLLLGVAPFAYYWGNLCGNEAAKQEYEKTAYEEKLVSLGKNILYLDGVLAKETAELKQVISASLETDFTEMVMLFMEHNYDELEYVRCAVTRRIRAMKQEEIIFPSNQSAQDIGYPVESINGYLETHCIGDPSHKNWATQEELKS